MSYFFWLIFFLENNQKKTIHQRHYGLGIYITDVNRSIVTEIIKEKLHHENNIICLSESRIDKTTEVHRKQ